MTFDGVFFFKQKTAYGFRLSLVGTEMCMRDGVVISVCSVCVQCVFSVCSVCVQCVFSVCSVCVQCVFGVCSVCVL